MKCPKCGWNNDDNAVFCENCGEFLEDKHEPQKNQKAVFWGLTIAGVLCVILVIGVIAVVALKRIDSEPVLKTEESSQLSEITPTREIFTPTPTLTVTPTITPTVTPTVTPTPTPTPAPAVIDTPIPTQPTHSYAVVEGDYTWEQAYSTARNMGGHLVTITNSQEQEAVENLCNEYPDLHVIWMGATNLSGSYQWITDEDFSYTKWASGEPNNEFNEEHYLAMYYLNLEGWVWNDEPNDAIKYYSGRMGFVIEYE